MTNVVKDPSVLFARWYREPLRKLKEIPNGDGGFVALIVSCVLYERYAAALLTQQGKKADQVAIVGQLASDFYVCEDTAEMFWDAIRNGLVHGAMPKVRSRDGKRLPRWHMSHDVPRPMWLYRDDQGSPVCLDIQPWLFMDRVLRLWERRRDLIECSPSFPWGQITTRQ